MTLKNLFLLSLSVAGLLSIAGCKNSDPSTPDGVVNYAGIVANQGDLTSFNAVLTGRALSKFGNEQGMKEIARAFADKKTAKLGKPVLTKNQIINQQTVEPDMNTKIVLTDSIRNFDVPVASKTSTTTVEVVCKVQSRVESSGSSSSSSHPGGRQTVSISASYSSQSISNCKIENMRQ